MPKPTQGPRPEAVPVGAHFRCHHAEQRASLMQMNAWAQDAWLRGRRRDVAEAQGPRRGHAARRGKLVELAA